MEREGLLVLPMTKRLEETAGSDDAAAFEELMHTHERAVLRVAYRLTGNLEDAKDAAQEVFLRLHRNLRSMKNADAVGPWLYRVTVNVCSDVARRNKVRSIVEVTEVVSSGPGPEALAVRRETEARIGAALARLGDRERAALVLRDLEGLSTAEVAQSLGTTESTIRVQISKARLKLRELLRGLR